MIDFDYRNSLKEQERINDLLKLITKDYTSILDIGSRDCYITRLLKPYFKNIVALDIDELKKDDAEINKVRGNVVNLSFHDNSIDVILCSEVLEHIQNDFLGKACQEIIRVAKLQIIIGVPFNEDIRVGRTTCLSCGKINNAWGHVNTFTKEKLLVLFAGLNIAKISYVGKTSLRTNAISTYLFDLAGNPWGAYHKNERCSYCDNFLLKPESRNILQKICSKIAFILERIQKHFTKEQPIWIHIVFNKM